ncbi:hypothetical protein [Gimesia chilikensis]|uniref:5'-methylthioadenosine/S-adenosylhomocysteine nucleosidase family protein n=1 Tax=Gimesia chilikensis TaxID=2605989 RepID=UPI003A9146A3
MICLFTNLFNKLKTAISGIVCTWTHNTDSDLKCDILLFFATQTEKEQLEIGAHEFGFPFKEKSNSQIGSYYDLGTIGPNRVLAVKTRMGAFFHKGSASQAIVLQATTSATSIIQLGMAFGIDRDAQNHGDVLISEWLFPYDYRTIEHDADEHQEAEGYRIDYNRTTKFRAKQSLINMFDRERSLGDHTFVVHSGGLLSGGSRIFSQLFLRKLLFRISSSSGTGGFIGGEMEGVGLLAASNKANPVWIVVKGISDFADDQRHEEIIERRPEACLNAVRFVFSALLREETVQAE